MRKVNRFHVLAIGAAMLSLALTGCGKSSSSSSNANTNKKVAVNTKCPISGDAVDASIETVDFGNFTIGFCCGDCPAKFDAWTAEQKAKWLSEETGHPVLPPN